MKPITRPSENLPLDYPIRTALRIYGNRLGVFFLIAALNYFLFGLMISLLKVKVDAGTDFLIYTIFLIFSLFGFMYLLDRRRLPLKEILHSGLDTARTFRRLQTSGLIAEQAKVRSGKMDPGYFAELVIKSLNKDVIQENFADKLLQSVGYTFKKSENKYVLIQEKRKKESLHDFLNEIVEGDSTVVENLYKEINEPLLRHIQKRYDVNLTTEDMEDIVRQTLFQVWRNADQYRGSYGEKSARRWMYSIASNQAKKYLVCNMKTVDIKLQKQVRVEDLTTASNLWRLGLRSSYSEKEKIFLDLYFNQGLGIELSAKIMDISKPRLKQIVDKTLEEILKTS